MGCRWMSAFALALTSGCQSRADPCSRAPAPGQYCMGQEDEKMRIQWDVGGALSIPQCPLAIGRVGGDPWDGVLTHGTDGAGFWPRDPDAVFRDPVVIAGDGVSVHFVDWDHDGDDEFALVDGGSVSILPSPGDTPVPLGSVGDGLVRAVGHLMGDDNLDIALEEGSPETGLTLRWFRGTGTDFIEEGSFIVPPEVYPWGRGDWDGDGYTELAYLGYEEAVVVEPGAPPQAWETDLEFPAMISSVDLDGDGAAEFVALGDGRFNPDGAWTGYHRMEIQRPSGREVLEIPGTDNLVPGNFDGVGGDEVLLQGGPRSHVLAYADGNPNIVPVDLEIGGWPRPHAAQLDDDGISDLVVTFDTDTDRNFCRAVVYRSGLRTGDGPDP